MRISGVPGDIVGFAWDAGNRDKNKAGHSVEWWECEEVFFNYPLFSTIDVKHSGPEDRCLGLGRTNRNRFLMVVFTIRNCRIRVISARDMNRKERSRYYEEIAKIQE